MRAIIEAIALQATARKGNHPVLWLVFGLITAVNAATSLHDGRTFVPDPKLDTYFVNLIALREASFSAEPILFVGWVSMMCITASICTMIGSTAILLRIRRRKHSQPFTRIRSR
jgi:hypothetical protein